jgi:Zn-dependent protease
VTCAGCGAQLGPSLVSCPRCHTLVHADRLKSLAKEATDAQSRGDLSVEIRAWRAALDLLPVGSAQHTTILARVEQLGALLMDGIGQTASLSASAAEATVKAAALEGQPVLEGQPASGSRRKAWTGGAMSGGGLLLWKLKTIIVLGLTKGKLLLLGLTKGTTLLSMIPALGVYWVAFGWRFAAGLIASIYVHEMGHVFALSRFGIAASAPMFLPGIGAVIRSRAQLTNPREEARVGLGGPIWGLGAAVVAFVLYAITNAPIWLAIAHFGAWVNLFNLLPVWQLDGAHAFKALNRQERWFMTAAIVAMFFLTQEGLLVLIALAAGWQALRADADAHPEGDRAIAAQYAGLIIILSAMSTIGASATRP